MSKVYPMGIMDVGRELDVAVARALGIKTFTRDGESPDWVYYIPGNKPKRTHSADTRILPRFSTDIAAAMSVVERLCPPGPSTENRRMFTLTCSYPFGKDKGDLIAGIKVPMWSAFFEEPGPLDSRRSIRGSGATAPEAICRAALAAVGAGREEE